MVRRLTADEGRYVASLGRLITHFQIPLEAMTDREEHPPLRADEVETLFFNVSRRRNDVLGSG